MDHEHALFRVEGRDGDGKLFQTEVAACELRHGNIPSEIVNSFEERSRRAIIECANEHGDSVRRIKRVD